MNKLIKWTLITLLIVGILGACDEVLNDNNTNTNESEENNVAVAENNENESNNDEEQNKADEQAKKEEEKAKKEQKEKEKKEKEQAEKEKKEAERQDKIETYHIQVSSISDELADNFFKFSDYSYELADNYSVVYDSEFVAKYVSVMLAIDSNLDEYEALNVPEEVQPIQDELIQAVEYYRSIYRDMPEAIDNMDEQAILKVTEDMDKGTEHMERATELIESGDY